ncbi:MAG: class IV adenylate cyclase [Promethearchaeota archaeon]
MEIEIKIPLKEYLSSDKMMLHLRNKFGNPSEEITHIDTYFNSPIHNFQKTDEALRLRQIQTTTGKERIEITYKGPKKGKNMKIREEITIKASNSSKVKNILQNLGFNVFGMIKKRRINWIQENLLISFDIVEGLGSFLEIETMINSRLSEEINRNKERIIQLVKEIFPNWSGEDERKSYLELIMEKQIKNQGT